MATVPLGHEGTISIGSDELGIFTNVDHLLSADDETITSGGDGGWENWQQAEKRLELSIDCLYVLTSTALAALYTAWMDDDDLTYSAVDANGYGWSCTIGILSISEGVPAANRITVAVEAKSRGTVTRTTPSS